MGAADRDTRRRLGLNGHANTNEELVATAGRDRAAPQDVKGLEVEVDRVGVAAEVDQLPHLPSAEHREERRRVLKMACHRAQARHRLVVLVDDGDHGRIGAVLVGRLGQLAHGQHVRHVLELLLDERDGTPDGASEVCAGGSGEVGGGEPGRPEEILKRDDQRGSGGG